MTWGSPVEIETRNRIRLSVAAHSYEMHSRSFLSDAEYDALSREIDLSISTTNPKLDNFFREHFHPDTGMWIHKHPDRAGLEKLYQKFYKDRSK
ncbi:DNA ligase LigA-related protein [Shimia sp.]|uniref:DNA ligase LigA-related protein n=1 Tax=Shimia sp. TaxID=1954381 RepID=UPI003BA980E4